MELVKNGKQVHISVVSPVYKAEFIVDELVKRIKAQVSTITEDFEIILVEDCGPDNSWSKIVENCKKDTRVKGLKLSKNFGQHHAITAGLDYSRGQWVVVMDCDLQDVPEEIPRLYQQAQKGYEIVLARRKERQDKFVKRMTSKLFYVVFSYLSGVKQDGTIANFGIYHRKVIDTLVAMKEPMRAFSPMVQWVGFNKIAIDVTHAERFEGKTSYRWGKLIELALNIAISYSDKPLRLVIKAGLFMSLGSVIFSIYSLVIYFQGRILVSGYTSLIVSIWFLSGLIIFILGIVGLYVGKTFDGIKNRPIYIINKEENINE